MHNYLDELWLKAYPTADGTELAVCINSETHFLAVRQVADDIYGTDDIAPPKWFRFLWQNMRPEMLELGFQVFPNDNGTIYIRWRDMEAREVRDAYELAHEPGDEIYRGMLPLGRR